MRRHVEALFLHTEGGRLRARNEPNGGPAPRFFLGRTNDGNISRYRFDVADALVRHLEKLCLTEPVGRPLGEEPAHLANYLALLATDSPVQKVWTGPAYSFPEVLLQPRRVAVSVTSTNLDVLRSHFPDWVPDVPHCRPFLAILENGQAVSICASVRITPEAHEAGVETVADCRGKGYASDVVIQWAHCVRLENCAPLYSTSWKNVASIAVANRLGLRLYGSDFHAT